MKGIWGEVPRYTFVSCINTSDTQFLEIHISTTLMYLRKQLEV